LSFRIAHATDIHWQVTPGWADMTVKRILGTANLYLANRRHQFDPAVQQCLADHLVALDADLVVITGDLTAQALDSEFELARDTLGPLLGQTPTFVIPGNHDLYTPGAQRKRRIHKHFGQWMGSAAGAITRFDCGPITCLGLDPNRPTLVVASGLLPQEQLDSLAETLRAPSLKDQFVVLAIHYPLIDRRGDVYDGLNHGLVNAQELISVLAAAPKKPGLILCGHKHHGFWASLDLAGTKVPVSNCGSSGYAHLPDKDRAAAMCVYQIADGGIQHTERYLYDGAGFAPEPGGAWETGR
jgi:3',5'-cyclic AMP phosphodiesterase CpdA